MQSGEWRYDANCSNYISQQQPSTAFCIDNILGKPSVSTEPQNPGTSSPYNMEQARLHNSYRTASYPLVLQPRAYHNPFITYQRHHPYAMPMTYNIQAPMIPSIYDAFQDPMGKYLRSFNQISWIFFWHEINMKKAKYITSAQHLLKQDNALYIPDYLQKQWF